MNNIQKAFKQKGLRAGYRDGSAGVQPTPTPFVGTFGSGRGIDPNQQGIGGGLQRAVLKRNAQMQEAIGDAPAPIKQPTQPVTTDAAVRNAAYANSIAAQPAPVAKPAYKLINGNPYTGGRVSRAEYENLLMQQFDPANYGYDAVEGVPIGQIKPKMKHGNVGTRDVRGGQVADPFSRQKKDGQHAFVDRRETILPEKSSQALEEMLNAQGLDTAAFIRQTNDGKEPAHGLRQGGKYVLGKDADFNTYGNMTPEELQKQARIDSQRIHEQGMRDSDRRFGQQQQRAFQQQNANPGASQPKATYAHQAETPIQEKVRLSQGGKNYSGAQSYNQQNSAPKVKTPSAPTGVRGTVSNAVRKTVAPVVAGSMVLDAAEGLQNQEKRSVDDIKERGGFWQSSLKDAFPTISAAGQWLGESAAQLVTGYDDPDKKSFSELRKNNAMPEKETPVVAPTVAAKPAADPANTPPAPLSPRSMAQIDGAAGSPQEEANLRRGMELKMQGGVNSQAGIRDASFADKGFSQDEASKWEKHRNSSEQNKMLVNQSGSMHGLRGDGNYRLEYGPDALVYGRSNRADGKINDFTGVGSGTNWEDRHPKEHQAALARAAWEKENLNSMVQDRLAREAGYRHGAAAEAAIRKEQEKVRGLRDTALANSAGKAADDRRADRAIALQEDQAVAGVADKAKTAAAKSAGNITTRVVKDDKGKEYAIADDAGGEVLVNSVRRQLGLNRQPTAAEIQQYGPAIMANRNLGIGGSYDPNGGKLSRQNLWDAMFDPNSEWNDEMFTGSDGEARKMSTLAGGSKAVDDYLRSFTPNKKEKDPWPNLW